MVEGAAAIGGNVTVDFLYRPEIGASFVVLSGLGGLTGAFDAIVAAPGLLLVPTYGVSTVTLTVAAVPEAESYVRMLAGLVLVAAFARRRRVPAAGAG